MKSKTIWYILLGIIIFSSMVMSGLNRFIGMILFGISCYVAGAYHIKWRLEKGEDEFKKLL